MARFAAYRKYLLAAPLLLLGFLLLGADEAPKTDKGLIARVEALEKEVQFLTSVLKADPKKPKGVRLEAEQITIASGTNQIELDSGRIRLISDYVVPGTKEEYLGAKLEILKSGDLYMECGKSGELRLQHPSGYHGKFWLDKDGSPLMDASLRYHVGGLQLRIKNLKAEKVVDADEVTKLEANLMKRSTDNDREFEIDGIRFGVVGDYVKCYATGDNKITRFDKTLLQAEPKSK